MDRPVDKILDRGRGVSECEGRVDLEVIRVDEPKQEANFRSGRPHRKHLRSNEHAAGVSEQICEQAADAGYSNVSEWREERSRCEPTEGQADDGTTEDVEGADGPDEPDRGRRT